MLMSAAFYFFLTSDSWLNQVEHIVKNPSYSCLVLDNRGYGNSDIPGGKYKLSQATESTSKRAT